MSGGITSSTVAPGHLSRASVVEAEKPALRVSDEAPRSEVHNASLSQVWIDRDLSWLEFNRRVLAEAVDERTPLLEQAKFLAIFTSNLDEFFMKRVAVLRERVTAEGEQLIAEIRARLDGALQLQARHFSEQIVPRLAEHGVFLRRWEALTAAQQDELGAYFDDQVSAALTPLVIHPSQPFPFFSNLSQSLAFLLHDDRRSESVHARVKVPADLPQWAPVTADTVDGERVFVRLQEVIRENAHKLYPGMRLTAATLFRLTRDAELGWDDEHEMSVRQAVREGIRQRRFEPVVRLEFAAGADPGVRHMLQSRFGLTERDVYELPGELDYSSLFQIASLDLPPLRDTPWVPTTPPRLAGDVSIFDVIREDDLLVHHPYESFDASVERFINAAATDPQTVAIKMTVYRVGDDTPFVRSLIRAAESGKQVACVIELKARFDEERNLHWAAELERAGAHVTVGDLTLKTHAKIALVVRREGRMLRRYAHLGTGNYHVRTARLYTDIGLLTCDPVLTSDVAKIFHHLTGRSNPPQCRTLFVAPAAMRERFLALIAREAEHHRAGRPARIIAKMNQLEDPQIIAGLCEASRAGVPIDLIVRGFCCMAPGIPGFSESIRVRSIVGRFLEHSRIFYFAAGSADPLEGEFFIGSADWMFRNLSHRVEVVAPVTALHAKERLREILDVSLQDHRQSWAMRPDGSYERLRPETRTTAPGHVGTHQTMMDLTRRRARRIS